MEHYSESWLVLGTSYKNTRELTFVKKQQYNVNLFYRLTTLNRGYVWFELGLAWSNGCCGTISAAFFINGVIENIWSIIGIVITTLWVSDATTVWNAHGIRIEFGIGVESVVIVSVDVLGCNMLWKTVLPECPIPCLRFLSVDFYSYLEQISYHIHKGHGHKSYPHRYKLDFHCQSWDHIWWIHQCTFHRIVV